MEIRYLFGVIRAHFRFVLIMTLAAGATGLLATYVLRENFEAPTLILIRPQRQRNFAPSGSESKATLDYPVSFNIPPGSVSETYATIMTSPAVAKRVVELLALDRPVPPQDGPLYARLYRSAKDVARKTLSAGWDFLRYGRVEPKDPYWQRVEDVTKGLQASPVEDTYLFKLTATWDDPQMAARIADTAAQVFIEYTLQARRREETAAVATMNARLERLTDELVGARDRLRAFESKNQSAVPSRRLELKLDALTSLETRRDEVTRQLAGNDARIGSLQGQLASEPLEVPTGTTLARNEFLNGIRTELANDERKLAEREQTMTPEHPEVKALRARIEASSRRIAQEQEMIHLRDESSRNPVHENLRKELLDGETTRESLKATARELDQTIPTFRKGIDELVERRIEQERLALDVSVLEDEYKFVSREQAGAQLAVEQALSDIRALAPAIPPVYPKGPLKILYGGLGLFSGFLAAIGLILAADYAEPRIRSTEDVERLVGVPVIETWHAETRKLKTGLILADGQSSSAQVWRVLAAAINENEGESRDDR